MPMNMEALWFLREPVSAMGEYIFSDSRRIIIWRPPLNDNDEHVACCFLGFILLSMVTRKIASATGFSYDSSSSSFSQKLDGALFRGESVIHYRLHIYPPNPCGLFYFPWHRHHIEGTTGF